MHTYSHIYTENENKGEREVDFKELAHMTAGLGKSKICRAGQQAGDPTKR